MNSDDHIEALKKHFIEEIQEALYESKQDHGETINYDQLNDKILKLEVCSFRRCQF